MVFMLADGKEDAEENARCCRQGSEGTRVTSTPQCKTVATDGKKTTPGEYARMMCFSAVLSVYLHDAT
jgi:hypothetical protein